MITKLDIDNAIRTFDVLNYGQGKVGAATALRGIINMYIEARLTEGKQSQAANKLTNTEISLLKAGQKLPAVKSVKERLNLSLLGATRYVETHGDQFLPVNYPHHNI